MGIETMDNMKKKGTFTTFIEWATRGTWTYGQSSDPALARSGFWSAGTQGSTGLSVDQWTALNYSVFWACVRNISEDVASMPLMLYKRLDDGGKEPLRRHQLSRLLHDEPNPEMDAMTFRQALIAHALTWGNGYAEIQRNGAGQPVALWPITPDRVQVKRDASGNLYYEVSQANNGGAVALPAANVFHLPGLGFDGVCGYSVVDKAKESIGLGLAAERYGGKFFGNGATMGGVISLADPLTEQAKLTFQQQMAGRHEGVERAHKFLLLGNGAKYTPNMIPPDNAQFLETRLFQIEEICRWFRSPPHKVQHLEKTSYNSIEHQGIEYYTDTLRPWCVRFELAAKRKLIAPSERWIQFFEHNMDGVLRGDLASRYSAYGVGRQWGFLSVNDIRKKENLNPIGAEGDMYLVPVNMQPSDKTEEFVQAQIDKMNEPTQAPPAGPSQDDADRANAMVAEFRTALAEAEARLAEQATKTAELVADFTAATAQDKDRQLAEQRTLTAEAQANVAQQQALLLLAAERADSLQAAVDAAKAEADARLEAQAQALEQARSETVTALNRESETQAQLDEAAARATRLESDHAVMRQTQVAAEDMIAQLQAQLLEADARLETDRAASDEARSAGEAHLAALRSELETARAVAAQVAADRDRAVTDAEAAAETAAAAHAAMAEATQRLADVTTNSADATRALEEERAKDAERLDQAEAALRTLQASVIAHRQKQMTEHRKVWEIAAAKVFRIERDRATKNSLTPDRLMAWAEGFYLPHAHEDTVLEALLPLMRQHLAFIESNQDPETCLRAIVVPHVQAARAQIVTLAKGDADELRPSLERLFTRWEHDRPAAIADAILQEEVTYVRSL